MLTEGLVYSYSLEGNRLAWKEDVEMGRNMGRWSVRQAVERSILSFTSFDLYFAGIVTPSPACKRALQEVVSALEADGHEVVDMYASSLAIPDQLTAYDSCVPSPVTPRAL